MLNAYISDTVFEILWTCCESRRTRHCSENNSHSARFQNKKVVFDTYFHGCNEMSVSKREKNTGAHSLNFQIHATGIKCNKGFVLLVNSVYCFVWFNLGNWSRCKLRKYNFLGRKTHCLLEHVNDVDWHKSPKVRLVWIKWPKYISDCWWIRWKDNLLKM